MLLLLISCSYNHYILNSYNDYVKSLDVLKECHMKMSKISERNNLLGILLVAEKAKKTCRSAAENYNSNINNVDDDFKQNNNLPNSLDVNGCK